ncbi:MAG: hypothetical protein ACRCVT_13685 [Leadbetterella sp.]
MKNIKLIAIVSLFFAGLLACRDESKNPIPELKEGVTFTATANNNAAIFLDIATYNATTSKLNFEASSIRPDLVSKIEGIAEYIPATGARVLADKSPVITITDISTAKKSYSVEYQKMFDALKITASSLKPGDQVRMRFVGYTPDGRSYSEANTVASAITSGFGNFTTGFSTTIACVFNPKQFEGTWAVDVDEWEDYKKGDVIKVTAGPRADELTIGVFATDVNHKDIVLKVTNLNTGVATVAKQNYGAYKAFPAIGELTAEGTGSVSGCAGTITLSLTHRDLAGASYGTARLILVKK